MLTLYGITNCDTVKKARVWLEKNDVSFKFHDFRKDGLEKEKIQGWLDQLGWETLVNKRSTSWKQLSESARKSMDKDQALVAILASPTLIKRPVLESSEHLTVGFSADNYAKLGLGA